MSMAVLQAERSIIRMPAGIPSTAEALSLIGGAPKLAKLRAQTLKLATATVPTKLQLAVFIAQKYQEIRSRSDLSRSVRPILGDSYQVEHMAYVLNREDGPWAVAVSSSALTWKPVTNDDITALSTCGDLMEVIFHHLR